MKTMNYTLHYNILCKMCVGTQSDVMNVTDTHYMYKKVRNNIKRGDWMPEKIDECDLLSNLCDQQS